MTDPCLVTHWSILSPDTCSHATLQIISSEVFIISRTSFHVRAETNKLYVVCSDGTDVIFPDTRQISRISSELVSVGTRPLLPTPLLEAWAGMSVWWQLQHIRTHGYLPERRSCNHITLQSIHGQSPGVCQKATRQNGYSPSFLNRYEMESNKLSVCRADWLLKVTVQFEWCFRLMEHISVISWRNPINLYITKKLLKFSKSLLYFYLEISNK